MLLHRFNDHLNARDGDLRQDIGNRSALFRGDTTGSTIGNFALSVQSAVVSSHCDVAFSKLEADARCLQSTPSDQVRERVIAEETEMAGA